MPCSASSARAGASAGLRERRGDRGLRGTLADQRAVGAAAEREADRIEQDRLAGAGLAGQHAEPAGELEVEPLDQDEVADREAGQHGAGRSVRALAHPAAAAIRARARAHSQRLAVHQPVAVLIPAAAREVVAEHRRGAARLLGDAQRQIGLGQAMQRLGHMGRALVAARSRCGSG